MTASRGPRLRPTLRDVAGAAGVSIATASRILTGARESRPATRARVLAAASRLDYRPSGLARALKLQHTRTLGLLVTDIENPYFPEVVRSVEDAAHARGYAVLLCNSTDDPARELAYLNLLLERRVDGIIVAASRVGTRHAALLSRAPVPVVLVNSEAPRSGLTSITSDNRAGARLAAEHLLQLGHRRLGHITADAANAAAGLRLAGIRDALGGQDPPGAARSTLTISEGDAHVAGGERATHDLLAREPDLTAVLCYNDLTAIGTLRALRASGRRVPDDVSVVGFDDIDLARWTDPPLTTVAQQKGVMGRWAFETLAKEMETLTHPRRRRVVLPAMLIVRETTGVPPSSNRFAMRGSASPTPG